MKKLILTFFLIVLIVLLIRRNEHFVEGCKIANFVKPTENDFYQCFLDDIRNYNKN